jgi:hypothetical protein
VIARDPFVSLDIDGVGEDRGGAWTQDAGKTQAHVYKIHIIRQVNHAFVNYDKALICGGIGWSRGQKLKHHKYNL